MGIHPVYHPLSAGIQYLGSRWGSIQFTTHFQLGSRIWDPGGDPSSLSPIVIWDPGSRIQMGIHPVYRPLSFGIQDLGSRWGSIQFTTHCQLGSRIWDPGGDPSSLPPIVSCDPRSGIPMGSIQFTTHCQLGSRIWDIGVDSSSSQDPR